MRMLLLILVLIGIGIAAWVLIGPGMLREGDELPPFTIDTITHRAFDLSRYDGERKCLLFFSVDEERSAEAFSALTILTTRFKRAGDLRYIAIAVMSDADRVRLFLSQYRFTGEILMDEDGTVRDRFRIGTLPAVFAVDGDNRILFSTTEPDRDDMRRIAETFASAAGQ